MGWDVGWDLGGSIPDDDSFPGGIDPDPRSQIDHIHHQRKTSNCHQASSVRADHVKYEVTYVDLEYAMRYIYSYAPSARQSIPSYFRVNTGQQHSPHLLKIIGIARAPQEE